MTAEVTDAKAVEEGAPDVPEVPDVAAVPDLSEPRQHPVALIVLAFIAVVAALYFARAFFVPLLIGILASYTLRPVVDRLQA